MPAPTISALYGPSRDFWPKNTLTRAQALALPTSSSRRADVPFTKAAVQDALDAFSDEDWDRGVVVFTQAGNNDEGKGAGAGSTSWLKTGRSGRKMRALVTPLGTFGSCTFTKSMVIDADGVAFGGYEFIAPKSNGLLRGILLRGASNTAIFNMWPLYYWGVQSVDNQAASTIELVNIVLPEGPLKIYPDNSFDSAAIRTASNAPITDVLLTGVYEGPSFREKLPAGKKPSEAAHTDSRQISGGSLISNVRQRRSVTWGSTNAAIQSTGALTGYHFEQSLVIGGPSTNKRYPVPEGTDEWRPDGSGFVKPNALNGGPTGCTADGLVVIGTVGQFKFTYAKDSWLSEAPQGSQQPTTGATWGVDTTLASKPLSWFDTVAPNYTRAQIKSIFDGSTVVVPEDDYPTAPNLAIPAVTTSKVSLSWTAATDAEGPVTYEIERNGELVASVSSLTWENSGLPVATTYQYQVFAVDNADQRTGSNVRTVTTGSGTADTTPPSKPVLTVTDLTPTSGTLNWTAATDDIGVTGYDVMVNGSLAQRVSSSARSLKATGLTPDTDYDVAVIAYDAAGNRKSSDLLPVTTPGTADTVAPTAPTLAPPTVGVSTIDYSWGGATDDRGTIRDYTLYLNNAPTTVTGTSYQAVELAPATEYVAYVVANDPAGNKSPASNIRTVTTGTETNPPQLTLGLPAAGTLPQVVVQQFRWGAVDLESGVATSTVIGLVEGAEVVLGSGSELAPGTWGVDITTATLPAKLSEYLIEGTDKAGNKQRTARVAVSVPIATPPDTTGPVVVVTQPAGGSVVPDFLELLATVSDAPSGVSSAEVRLAGSGQKLADLDPLNAADSTWAARIPRSVLRAAVDDGSTQLSFVVRGYDRRGNWTDSAVRTVTVPAPAETFTGTLTLTLPAGGFVDATGQRISDGRYVIAQRVTFPNADRVVTQAATVLIIDEGVWLRGNEAVTEVDLEIPPGASGLMVELEVPGVAPDRALYLLPEAIPADRRVSITELRRSGIGGQSEPLVFLPAAAEAGAAAVRAEAAADRAEAAAEGAGGSSITLTRDPSGIFATIRIG